MGASSEMLVFFKDEPVIHQLHFFDFRFNNLLFPKDIYQSELSILLRLYEIHPLKEQLFFAIPEKKCISFAHILSPDSSFLFQKSAFTKNA